MSNFIRLDRRKHESFLADHCYDPTTKELLKVGDEVCICANCKSPHLKSVWLSAKLCPSCRNESKRTLTEIPNTKSLNNFAKKTETKPPVVQSTYKGYFIFFLITSIISGIVSISFYSESEKWKEQYWNKNYEINNLNSKISNLTNTTSQLSSEKNNIKQQLNNTKAELYKLEELKVLANKLSFTTGIKYEDRKKYLLKYGNNKAKVYFTVNFPVNFKSVQIDASGSGYIYGYIYDLNDNKICQAYNSTVTNGVESLAFNCTLEKGSYYLTHNGNTDLGFIENFNKYPLSDNIISITRTQYNSKYYMNFFEWSYELNIE